MFPKIGVPQNGWFIVEMPIKMDDLGVSLFLETPIWIDTVKVSIDMPWCSNQPFSLPTDLVAQALHSSSVKTSERH